MAPIKEIAKRHGLWVVEDAAHAPNSKYHGRRCGSFGDVNAFSLHPLKNVNVWGDGGVITTDSDEKAATIRGLRNHGMRDRDTCEFWGYNSRLDTVQAVVASHALAGIEQRTARRRDNAALLDAKLVGIGQIETPVFLSGAGPNYYLYAIHAERRDDLKAYLIANGVDAKVHYPTPLHLQPAAKYLGYKRGDFPVAEWCAETTLSLPIHEFIREAQLERMAKLIRGFMRGFYA
jgi:aminotransferase EvaB